MNQINKTKGPEMEVTMKKLAESLGMKSIVDMATGVGSLSYFMDDEDEANRLKSFLGTKFNRARLIPLNKKEGDSANWVVAADMHGDKK